MDDDRSAERGNGRGVEVERAVEILPGGYGRGDVGLVYVVERQFGLGEELVP